MKVRGIKRGNTIELVDQAIDIPDGTEITVTINEQPHTTPEAYLKQLQASFAANSSTPSTATEDNALMNLIGSAAGSFPTPEAADEFIRQERDAWDY